MLVYETETEQINAAITAGYETKDGLIWLHGKLVPLPDADTVANSFGWLYAEHMVRALKNRVRG